MTMRSGELAQRAGVSPDTVRHYERIGLLKVPPRTNGGYRNYPPETLDRVRMVRRALGVGFSLPELAKILRVRDSGGIPCQGVLAAAATKRKHLDQQISELKAMRRQLDLILKDWSARLASTKRGQPARLLESLPKEMEEHGHETHSRILRNFGRRRGGARSASK
ncbi:MAG TPA: heavy metal-responsive transcriptional regulator [Candidatus Acidoferrales bacterium]|nr:heavy metal-responsive transcriptional regulator [Candidatus Acidoferrales bacterium]